MSDRSRRPLRPRSVARHERPRDARPHPDSSAFLPACPRISTRRDRVGHARVRFEPQVLRLLPASQRRRAAPRGRRKCVPSADVERQRRPVADTHIDRACWRESRATAGRRKRRRPDGTTRDSGGVGSPSRRRRHGELAPMSVAEGTGRRLGRGPRRGPGRGASGLARRRPRARPCGSGRQAEAGPRRPGRRRGRCGTPVRTAAAEAEAHAAAWRASASAGAAWISIRRGLALSRIGSVSSSMPWRYVACTCSASMPSGSVNTRSNRP